mgnify:CR=1 FL=1
MPELPEVETIVRYLRLEICGRRILGLWTDTARLFRGTTFTKIKKEILGARILDVSRRGKNILFHLSGGRDLIFHLMMTGKLLLFPRAPKERHVHFWMKLGTKDFLALHDIRKFGWARLVPERHILGIGKDALSVSLEELKEIFEKRKGSIKSLLLNQSAISGIGNIYSDEILWYAGIGPARRAGELKERELRKLYLATKAVLNKAIKAGGTSSRDYRKPDGSKGGYYEIRKAYQRTGEKCSRDGTVIRRIKIGQRSAHFCPKHQN